MLSESLMKPWEKRPGEVRILLLGNEPADGLGLGRTDRLSVRLQLLSDRIRGRRVSGINAMQPGYTIQDSRRFLDARGHRYGPDIVLQMVDPLRDVSAAVTSPGAAPLDGATAAPFAIAGWLQGRPVVTPPRSVAPREPSVPQGLEAWTRARAALATRGAELAGEYALYFAERKFNKKFLPYKVKKQARTEKAAIAQRKKIDKLTKEMQDEFLDLARFGVGELAMAAKVRYGDVLSLYAQKVFEIPTPKYVIDLNDRAPELELLAKYEEGLAVALQKFVDEAKQSWVEVVQQGKQKKISNKWTKLALEHLNREFPDEYPILHTELNDGTEEP